MMIGYILIGSNGKGAELIILIFLSLLNLKSMLKEQLLEQKLRRSSCLSEKDIYQDFMDYAREVSDEMDIYLYMEENNIGIDQAKYWIARMEIMKKKCQLISLVKLINSLRIQGKIEQPWEINSYQKSLNIHLRNVFNLQFKGKRRAADFNRNVQSVHPERRKIGNIQVYVDQQCRYNYELEDFAEYIEKKMPEFCQIERQEYKRIQQRKAPSFIAKREQHLMQLAQEVMEKAGRKSHQERKSLGPSRFSSKINLEDPEQFEVDDYNTPKNNVGNKSQSTEKIAQIRERRKKDSGRDSIEILKSMKKQKRQSETIRSPKFLDQSHRKSMKSHQSEIPIQRCRSVVEPDNSFLSFSFGKNKRSVEQQRRQRISNQRQLQNRDNAILFHSFSQDNKFSQKHNLHIVKKEDFQLELIIKQIQRENYQKIDSKTFSSEINSNQENQYFHENDIQMIKKQRKPFQILLQAQGKLLNPQRHYRLQQLMDYDDQQIQNRNPQSQQSCTEAMMLSGQKHRQNYEPEYHSENKGRLSNIREQGSSYYSESKNKYRSSK